MGELEESSGGEEQQWGKKESQFRRSWLPKAKYTGKG
jgi:hypothetical protein